MVEEAGALENGSTRVTGSINGHFTQCGMSGRPGSVSWGTGLMKNCIHTSIPVKRFFQNALVTIVLLVAGSCTLLYSQVSDQWFESFEKHGSYLGREYVIIRNGIEDTHGFIWYATDRGLARFDGYQYSMFNPDAVDTTTLSSSNLQHIVELGDSLLAIGTAEGFVEFFDLATGKVRHLDCYRPEERVERLGGPLHSFRDIVQDKDGMLWCGGQFGLKRVDPSTMELTRYTPLDYTLDFDGWGADPNYLWDIEIDEDNPNRLFIGGQHGLFTFDITREKFIDIDTSVSYINNLLFVEGTETLYLKSWYAGLIRYNIHDKTTSQLTGYSDLAGSMRFRQINDSTVFLYHKRQGFGTLKLSNGALAFSDDPSLNPWLPGTHAMVGTDGLIDKNNRFQVFAGHVYWTFQLPVRYPLPKPELCVTQVAFGANPAIHLDHGTPITIPDNHSSINIRYAAINPPFPDSVEYAYKLDDGPWQTAGKTRDVAFNNLSHGEHILTVRASDETHFETAESEVLRFNVSLPLWGRLWFQVTAAALVLALILLVVRIRNRQIRTQNQIKEYEKEMAELELKALRSQMNPHFMFNSLNSIKNYILQSNTKQAAEYLSNFAHLIRLILQNSREKLISLKDEIETLLLYIQMEQMRFDDEFDFRCIIDENVDLEEVYLPPMIVQPYVENAIWHGLMHKNTKGQLTLKVQQEGEVILCTIEDDGIGRAAADLMKDKTAQKHKSMGMGITQDRIDINNRMNALGIQVNVEDLTDSLSGKPSGTRVTIQIPAHNHIEISSK